LPFDSFDLEALDRQAQGSESFDLAQDREPVEPFDIWGGMKLVVGFNNRQNFADYVNIFTIRYE
jgi:hypothetical protein